MANKKNILKPIVIGSAIAGAGFLTYKFLIKPLINKDFNDEDNTVPPALPTISVPTPQISTIVRSVTELPSGTTKFDPTKTLRPGMKSSLELQYSKRAFNDFIERSRQFINTFPVKNQSDFQFKKRLETISKLMLLDTNTEYGAGTENVAKVILGVTDFTYNRVKQQKTAFYKRLGLPNPY